MKKVLKFVGIAFVAIIAVGVLMTIISMSQSGEAQQKMNQGFDQAKQDLESK